MKNQIKLLKYYLLKKESILCKLRYYGISIQDQYLVKDTIINK